MFKKETFLVVEMWWSNEQQKMVITEILIAIQAKSREDAEKLLRERGAIIGPNGRVKFKYTNLMKPFSGWKKVSEDDYSAIFELLPPGPKVRVEFSRPKSTNVTDTDFIYTQIGNYYLIQVPTL